MNPLEFHRTFCSTCKAITVHVLSEGLKCLHHYDNKEAEKGLVREMTGITEMNNGTFSMDIMAFSRCTGTKENREEAMTYFNNLTLDELEQISFELKTYLLDRTMKLLGDDK